jgi:hypothetical protein
VLHDLGATEYANTDQRFEMDGADAAARFLTEHGVAAERVETAWTAIAPHTSVGLARRFGPLAAVAQIGIGTDIVGTHKPLLSAGFADRVQRTPAKAPPMSFPAHFHQLMYQAIRPQRVRCRRRRRLERPARRCGLKVPANQRKQPHDNQDRQDPGPRRPRRQHLPADRAALRWWPTPAT